MLSFIVGASFFMFNILILRYAVGLTLGPVASSGGGADVEVESLEVRKNEKSIAIMVVFLLFAKVTFLLGSTFVGLKILALEPLAYVSGGVCSVIIVVVLSLAKKSTAL